MREHTRFPSPRLSVDPIERNEPVKDGERARARVCPKSRFSFSRTRLTGSWYHRDITRVSRKENFSSTGVTSERTTTRDEINNDNNRNEFVRYTRQTLSVIRMYDVRSESSIKIDSNTACVQFTYVYKIFFPPFGRVSIWMFPRSVPVSVRRSRLSSARLLSFIGPYRRNIPMLSGRHDETTRWR